MVVSRRGLVKAAGATAGATAAGTFAYGELFAAPAPTEPTAMVAGSLLSIARELGGASVEAHGSAAVRRLVVEGARNPDAVALADPRLFSGIADRVTLFATNALVLVYDPASEHADRLEEDWAGALAASGLRLGRTDPRLDPLGYRTVMALRLAERHEGVPAGEVLDASTVLPETDLLNALEGGAVGAAFAYRNMAVERGLPYVPLPDRIDFSDPGHADEYASVSYDLGDRTLHGRPICYGALALTDLGGRWVERLVTARDRLEASGFAVPEDYPVYGEPVATSN